MNFLFVCPISILETLLMIRSWQSQFYHTVLRRCIGGGWLKRLFFAVSESLYRVLSENEWMIHKHVRIRKIRTIDRGRLIAWKARSCQLQYACCKHCSRSVCFEMATCFFFKFKRTLKWEVFFYFDDSFPKFGRPPIKPNCDVLFIVTYACLFKWLENILQKDHVS